ncbi:MFS superfamily sulfate permease-like transporter [Bradyrhizobium sp. i1.7.7]
MNTFGPISRFFPPATWLADYRSAWLRPDAIAGITLAAYAIPVSLAYAALAGLPPQIGIYGYMLGGIGYALLGSSRQLAVGPTSAISLMIAATVGALAGGDAAKYAEIASLAACAVALLCLISWLFKLSILVRLVSDSILVGFKAGAGLTIIMSQLPSLFGVAGGGHNFFDRAIKLSGQLGDTKPLVLAIGAIALVLLLLGERRLPGKPVGLTIMALSIVFATLLGALRPSGCRSPGRSPKGCRRSEYPGLVCLSPTNSSRWPRDACCWPILKVCLRPAALPPSMAMPLMSGRSFWAWGRRTSSPHSATAIPSPAACRNPPSTTMRARAPPWRW